MTGKRDGAEVTFVLRLEGPSSRNVTVEGTVEIDPQASLVDGRWVEQGRSGARSGTVSSASVDFFGGQGGRPSLGGRFLLSVEGSPVYGINLPTTRLASEW